jgi:5-methylcytosine-specific restriction endonuclease McrA
MGLRQGTSATSPHGRAPFGAALYRRPQQPHGPALWRTCDDGCIGTARQLDDVIPLAEGGSDTDANTVAACVPCHRIKSSREGHPAQGHNVDRPELREAADSSRAERGRLRS